MATGFRNRRRGWDRKDKREQRDRAQCAGYCFHGNPVTYAANCQNLLKELPHSMQLQLTFPAAQERQETQSPVQ
ncbi:Hypothetical predicted protein [Podarcis lilfordi]|uniref:Uncharacterized protein n=1 Tax=Podarcis lilfordi TaxID=74358 RepID=A0AA35KY52_9SAUR|nr:Hypothetical predicted protein [Podarcis lilfordi]